MNENRYYNWADFIQVDVLKAEALKQYEESLSLGTTEPFCNFIEEQLVEPGYQVELLYELTEELQQRLLALRKYQFDVRDRVVQALSEAYAVDISWLIPVGTLHHLQDPHQIVRHIRSTSVDLANLESNVLLDMVESSIEISQQIQDDIEMTHHFLSVLEDWLAAFYVMTVRQYQTTYPDVDGLMRIH